MSLNDGGSWQAEVFVGVNCVNVVDVISVVDVIDILLRSASFIENKHADRTRTALELGSSASSMSAESNVRSVFSTITAIPRLKRGLRGGGGGSDDGENGAAPHGLLARVVASAAYTAERLKSSESVERRVWDLFVALFVLHSAFTLPLRLAFRSTWRSRPFLATMYTLDYIGDLLFWIDIALRFRTPFVYDGVLVTSSKAIRAEYLSFWFWYDAFATLPYGLLSWVPYRHALLRLPRLLRLAHLSEYWQNWQHRTGHPYVVRLLNLMTWFLFTVHWLGCMYMAVAYWKGFAVTSWAAPADLEHASVLSQYLFTFFWAANQLTNKGGGPIRPVSEFERGFELAVAVLALFAVATIIGSISRVIAQSDTNYARFRERLDTVNMFMRTKGIPSELQERIRSHYISEYARHRGIETTNILSDLPINLRTRVALVLNEDILKKVFFFQASSRSFLSALAPCLRSRVFAPGDTIVTQGDTAAKEMYFIGSGSVSVIVDDFAVATMTEGEYFGELSLLSHTPRTATVTASGFVELYVLDRPDLLRVLESHPKEKRRLTRAVKARLAADLLAHALKNDAFPSRFIPRGFLTAVEAHFTRLPLRGDVTDDRTKRLSQAKMDEIREAFTLFDVDNSGELDDEELNFAIQTLGFDPHSPEMIEWKASVDVDGSGSVDFGEFMDMMVVLMAEFSDDDSSSSTSSSSTSSESLGSDSDARYLFVPDSPADAVYFVSRGTVAITRHKHSAYDDGQAIDASVAVFHAGSFFGAIHAGTMGVYAKAMPKTRILCFSDSAYLALAEEFPAFRNSLRTFVKRFADHNTYFGDATPPPSPSLQPAIDVPPPHNSAPSLPSTTLVVVPPVEPSNPMDAPSSSQQSFPPNATEPPQPAPQPAPRQRRKSISMYARKDQRAKSRIKPTLFAVLDLVTVADAGRQTTSSSGAVARIQRGRCSGTLSAVDALSASSPSIQTLTSSTTTTSSANPVADAFALGDIELAQLFAGITPQQLGLLGRGLDGLRTLVTREMEVRLLAST
ncbi:cyclic nucleotide-binding protein [Thecamonas trahens ATCC 50062]|uniref:Cyclic nucleotide-binding protein n=1 Tax=Thecamonas trahens ATCC 50062 TaxID=461836 RepID=A0A0L0DNI6_THETB|nr:cyclic nucleotide-binding protein [Thecamonas trahens ATCC 50062]KNC53825.1 cyclic nucleotide-binding protein [Thecamonas trahens ATCC 50062]|eukprot:XP_013754210.1 cyclic nucleotide-binding protein [Thecamonas trahens ATCC 50062]